MMLNEFIKFMARLLRKNPPRNQKTITETETWDLIRSFPGSETHLKRRVLYTKINVFISFQQVSSLLLESNVRIYPIPHFLTQLPLIVQVIKIKTAKILLSKHLVVIKVTHTIKHKRKYFFDIAH